MKMEHLILVFYALCLNDVAFARLGESAPECVARYGKPISVDQFSDGRIKVLFQKGPFTIIAEFNGDKSDGVNGSECQEITYRKKDLSRIFENEIRTLLKANGYGKEWLIEPNQAGNKVWKLEGGEAWGIYMIQSNMLILFDGNTISSDGLEGF